MTFFNYDSESPDDIFREPPEETFTDLCTVCGEMMTFINGIWVCMTCNPFAEGDDDGHSQP